MENYIEKIDENKLNFIICFYNDVALYHDYNEKINQIEVGTTLSIESLKSIFSFVNDINTLSKKDFGFKNFIPKNVLQFSQTEKKILWFSEAVSKKLLYKDELIPSKIYALPPLLWKLEKNNLSIYALKDTNINLKTKLFNAPFFNVYSTGNVCMGNALFENKFTDYEDIINDVETKFFNSYFTHSSHNKLLKTNFVTYCNETNSTLFDFSLLVGKEGNINNLL